MQCGQRKEIVATRDTNGAQCVRGRAPERLELVWVFTSAASERQNGRMEKVLRLHYLHFGVHVYALDHPAVVGHAMSGSEEQ